MCKQPDKPTGLGPSLVQSRSAALRPVPRPRLVLPDLPSTPTGPAEGFDFTLMTSNVLAPSLASAQWFPLSPPEYLDATYRFEGHIEEVATYRPSVLCLQEMGGHPGPWLKELKRLGYTARTARVPRKRHGVCIAYNHQEWTERRFDRILLADHITVPSLDRWCAERDWESGGGLTAPMATKTTDRWSIGHENIAAVAVLDRRHGLAERSKLSALSQLASQFSDMTVDGLDLPDDCASPKASVTSGIDGIVVCTCHLYWDPVASFDRLVQVVRILEKVRKINQRLMYPVFLAGDFNTKPSDPLYKILTSQKLHAADFDRLTESVAALAYNQSASRGKPRFDPATLCLQIPRARQVDYVGVWVDRLQALGTYQSAYRLPAGAYEADTTRLHWESDPVTWCEPPFTTYCDFVGTLDYVFYMGRQDTAGADEADCDPDRVHEVICRPLFVLRPPLAGEVAPGIPNEQFPSDHISLLTGFRVQALRPAFAAGRPSSSNPSLGRH
ncbi:RNA exonuclease ngl2 [Tieghemiomyces parasiticus]|uniref:RNA exonuclease ngl2 n=1 Tax=Tieghemiomyces parasiticus TaxID=78921 RepID=A0A9W8DXH0_9FUNG|nr:RNA exonuclease ngl2 [Tieghemiomyces parasiticus]